MVLDGVVSGLGLNNVEGNYPTNLPLVGASLEVYATNTATGERLGAAVHRKTIGSGGRWGPFVADAAAHYEFVVAAPGYATTHIYRSPFPRSSDIVGVPRDRIVLDGVSPPAGIPAGVPGISTARLKVADTVGRAVVGEFNDERIVGRAWPAAENQVVVLDLTG